MFISEIKQICNYRNLSGKAIYFDSKMNFLIGENNIGKTNILELLNIIFSTGKFNEGDFLDAHQYIQIKLIIKYNESELGFFENNFDIEDEHAITIIARQESIDERILYYHDTPTKTAISIGKIKSLNILYYFSRRMPSKEVDFRKTYGSGRVLNYIIQHSCVKMQCGCFDFINGLPKLGKATAVGYEFDYRKEINAIKEKLKMWLITNPKIQDYTLEQLMENDIFEYQEYLENADDVKWGREIYSRITARYDNVIQDFGTGLYAFYPDNHFYDPNVSNDSIDYNLNQLLQRMIIFRATSVKSSKEKTSNTKRPNNKVFVVHGHDSAVKSTVTAKLFISNLSTCRLNLLF